MTKLTRRGLLGAATTGTLSIAACMAPSTSQSPTSSYTGDVAFLHGVASGDPMVDRVIIWTRVTPKSSTGPIPVKYNVYDPENPAVLISGILNASATHDYCVKADVSGLAPGKVYLYKFTVETDAGEIVSPEGRLKTTEAHGDAPVRMGVVSCANWQFGYFNAYDALSKEAGLDVIIHLGDYLYEYGIDGYRSEAAQKLGRIHQPVTEAVTLDDYRMRHGQYRTDPALQAAHAAAPWICTWDDHESANNSYRTGAQNHNPEENEGDWSDRKQAAIQAYFEWLPIREPVPGKITSAVWRSFTFGDVATVHALESRLTGRSPDISWADVLAAPGDQTDMMMRIAETLAKINSEDRTLLGAEQEAWLAEELASSVQAGKSWQVLANQVVMARTRLPNLPDVLTAEQIAAQENPYIRQMIGFSALGLPSNPDAWDGFPAARERLYRASASAGARLVTLAGDTHTAWANTLYDVADQMRGVEFGCTSISSPGTGYYINEIPDLGALYADANKEVSWHDPFNNGYIIVTLTQKTVRAEYRSISGLLSKDYSVETVAIFETRQTTDSLSGLERVS